VAYRWQAIVGRRAIQQTTIPNRQCPHEANAPEHGDGHAGARCLCQAGFDFHPATRLPFPLDAGLTK